MRKIRRFLQFFTTFILTLAVPAGLYVVSQEADIRSRAGGTNANLVIDAAQTFPAYSNWSNLAQGGEERSGISMISAIKPGLTQIAPDYIRLDHIYDFYNVVQKSPDGRLTFNWMDLDRAVDDILSVGAKPFFSLSYAPTPLGTTNNTDMPNLEDWSQLVAATINRYSGIRAKGIQDVYYEVWNEPDLFGQFKVYPPKNYLDLYRASADGASRVTNAYPFKFGGPAITAFYPNWMDALVTYCRDNGVRLDFLSWHRYSENLDDFENDARAARLLISKYPDYSDLPLLITEAGIDSANNPLYDKRLSAIHTIGTVAVTDLDISMLFSFEAKDGPGQSKYWGRWGIFTHEKFGTPEMKDRGRALIFLNRLIGERLSVTGQGTWVKSIARKNGQNIIALIVNYDIDGKHSEGVQVKFVNLPFKKFTIRRSDFLGNTVTLPTTIEGNEFSTVQFFQPNSAAIIELVPTQ